MNKFLLLLMSILLLACGNDNKLNEEELRTYLIGGKWCWIGDDSCSMVNEYTADSVLMLRPETIYLNSEYKQFASYAYKIAKIDVATQTIYFTDRTDTVPFKVIAKDTFHMVGKRGYMKYFRTH